MPELIRVALGANEDGRLEVVATSHDDGTSDTVWHAWQKPTPGSDWTGWHRFGKPDRGILLQSAHYHSTRSRRAPGGVRHRR